MALQFILMGDIIQSSKYQASSLRQRFLGLISSCNEALEKSIISPYTVTLGDEFQGVAKSLTSVIDTIFYLEELILRRGLDFKMRYVTVQGHIDTPLNREKAYNMMGPGLTKAREILTDKGRGERKYRFNLMDTYLTNQINRLFIVIDGLTDRWDASDASLIFDMLGNTNNEEVGDKHGKNRSQIWKRRKHLMVEEYRALKEVLSELAQQK